jgi:hypothetical protein
MVTALVLTSPLVLRLGSAFLDDGTYDAYQFAWNLWWTRESLTHLRTDPFFTPYLFHPEGAPLLFHTFSFSLGVLSLPLQLLPGGLVTAHNLLVIAAPALGVFAAALLAHEVTRDRVAALAAGLVATVNAIGVWFVPVLYLSCTYLIAGCLWVWWRMQRRRRAGDVALVLVLLGVLVFASQEYAMMALALLALDSLARALAARALGLDPPWTAGTLFVWGTAALGLGALAWVAASAAAEPPPPLQVRLASAWLAGFVTPPWVSPPPLRFWTVIYLGTAPLLLLPIALLWGGRRTVFWLLALAATLAMALGPYLHLHHPYPDPASLPPTLPPDGPPGPYLLAGRLVPLLRFFRAPYRWVAAAEVALAVVTAVGVAAIRARIPGRRGRGAATAALLLLIAAGGAVDVRGLRAPLASAAIPAVYDVLARDPEPAAVLELPSGFVAGTFAVFSSLYMYYQTAHRKFLLEGTVARTPAGRQLVWQRAFPDFAALPWVKYVLVHHDLLETAYPASRRQVAEVESVLRRQATLVERAGAIDVWRLATFRPEAVRPGGSEGPEHPPDHREIGAAGDGRREEEREPAE